jgi:hypothetical protein
MSLYSSQCPAEQGTGRVLGEYKPGASSVHAITLHPAKTSCVTPNLFYVCLRLCGDPIEIAPLVCWSVFPSVLTKNSRTDTRILIKSRHLGGALKFVGILVLQSQCWLTGENNGRFT